MATIQTGRSLTITVDSTDYSAQVSSVTLEASQSSEQYLTLSSSAALVGPVTWTLNIEAFQDWGAAGSFCDAMWTAAAAGTAIAFSMGTDGSSFSGDIIPTFSTVGGAAEDALTVSWSVPVDGDVTKA